MRVVCNLFAALILMAVYCQLQAFDNFKSVPGGIAGILLDESDTPLVATFGDTRMPIIPLQGQQVALVPLPWDIVPGFYILSTLSEDNDFRSYTFSVKPGGRPLYPVNLGNREDGPEIPEPIEMDQDLSQSDGEVSNPDLSLVLPVDAPVARQYGALYVQPPGQTLPHTGIRFEINAADTAVVNPVFGQVVMIEPVDDQLYSVVIDHGNGLISVFSELGSVTANAEDWLQKGGTIGTISKSAATSLQPHWSLQMNGVWIDPMLLVSSQPRLVGQESDPNQ